MCCYLAGDCDHQDGLPEPDGQTMMNPNVSWFNVAPQQATHTGAPGRLQAAKRSPSSAYIGSVSRFQ
jgi:hypothetical protein